MANTRISIETTVAQKEALDYELYKRGITLTDWFNTKAAELAPIYDITKTSDAIQNLEELADAEVILRQIEQQDWSFTDADTTYFSHNIHPYPAKFIPQIPNTLIRMLSLKGERVWDPFGGSGTTALEALLLGRQAISSDIHPIATLVGQAKTTTFTQEDESILSDFVERLEVLARNSNSVKQMLTRYEQKISQYIPSIPNILKWFHPNAITELAYLRWQIQDFENENCKLLANVVLSKVIVKTSYQDSETRYTSKPREVERGATLRMFANNLSHAQNKMANLSALLKFRKAEFITSDLRENAVVNPDSVDLIVTSPPYPNATDYHLYHRFRLFWLGHDPRKLGKKEIGSHLRHQKEKTDIENYLEEMQSCLTQMFKGLRAGRYAILILGDAKFKGENYQTAELVGEVAKTVDFEFVGIVRRQVHSTKRSFISPARRLREEKLLILRKPLKKASFHLKPPPYKLWPYEEQLRKKEIEKVLEVKVNGNTNGILPVGMTPLEVDKLKRLTFTHGFWARNYYQESTWQAILENGDAFSIQTTRKDPKYATHGLHPYKGKFYPQLAKSLFNLAQLEPEQTVFDPFCGSGTVLLESYLNGLQATGFDLNPLAINIARVKTSILQLDLHLVDRLLTKFIQRMDFLKNDKFYLHYLDENNIDELKSWFPSPVLNKLGWILNEIDNVPEPTVREFLEICLSSIIRNISQQDPKDLRIRRRKQPIEDAPVKALFTKKVLEQRWRLRHFSKCTNRVPFEFGTAQVFNADSREKTAFSNAGIKPGSLDAVITSPPYATALPYIDTDRLSILLLLRKRSKERSQLEASLIGSREIRKTDRVGVDSQIESNNFVNIMSPTAIQTISTIYMLNREADVGFRRKNKAALLYRYYSDMTKVLLNLSEHVRKHGSLFFVIGDNKTKAGGQEIVIKSSQMIQETGENLGWNLIDVIPITVTQENRHHNKNSITKNDIVWFEKS